MKKYGFILGSLLLTAVFTTTAVAQPTSIEEKPYEDYTYDKTAVKEGVPTRYPNLREADVKYSKRIQRDIDLRQKQNKILMWPRSHFGEFIYFAVTDNDPLFNAYKNDSFVSVYTPQDIKERAGIAEQLQIQDPLYPDDPYALIDTTIVTPYDPYKMKKIRLLEDWIFDHKHSVFFPRLIAIAPLFQRQVAGISLGEEPMFWVKWDEVRNEFSQHELFNNFNDAARISYLDFFELRMFSSFIVKESNMYDYMIRDFEEFRDDGVGALLKGEEIKNGLFIFEHDLWEY